VIPGNSLRAVLRAAPWRVYLALLVAAVLWGSLYTAAKPAVEAAGALQVTLCRVVLASVCLGPLVLARGGTHALGHQWRAHWRGIVVLGFVNFGLSQVLALSALYFVPASVNAVLNNTHPLWVAIGTALFFPPRRPGLLIAGSLIALGGVVAVFLPDLVGAPSSGPAASLPGVVLSLAGSGVIALGTVVGRRIMPGSDPIAVTVLASAAAILPVALLTTTSGGIAPIVEATSSIKLLLIYLGVGCTAINFALWYYALKHVPAATASASQYLVPPIGVGLAAVFLGEPITSTLVIGTLCIVFGLAATHVATTTS
jgi:drug/metabolite transporter (DMT)-like permease